MTKVAAIQMTSSADVEANLARASVLLQQAANEGARLAVLPEMFVCLGRDAKRLDNIKEPLGQGPIQEKLQALAKQLNLIIVAGTIPIIKPETDKYYATSLVYSEQGELLAHYNKIHLFDVCLDNAKESYQESLQTAFGEHLCVVDTSIGRLGVAVCYDIRFPEMFRAMFEQGMELLALPAAFTCPTGQAHWQVLVRARAIESQCYVIASAEEGEHADGRETYGHSMIVNAWGEVLVERAQGEGIVMTEFDLDKLADIRKRMPLSQQQRFPVSELF